MLGSLLFLEERGYGLDKAALARLPGSNWEFVLRSIVRQQSESKYFMFPKARLCWERERRKRHNNKNRSVLFYKLFLQALQARADSVSIEFAISHRIDSGCDIKTVFLRMEKKNSGSRQEVDSKGTGSSTPFQEPVHPGRREGEGRRKLGTLSPGKRLCFGLDSHWYNNTRIWPRRITGLQWVHQNRVGQAICSMLSRAWKQSWIQL